MKSFLLKISILAAAVILLSHTNIEPPNFQGKAYYFSKSNMDLGKWGARLSEAQKKQIQMRLKNRLEKTFVLVFNKEESLFKEEDKLDAVTGATDSWGKNFAAGEQYKNVKADEQVQNQEFYGKKFLVKDKLQPIEWKLGTETKTIGNYVCYKATSTLAVNDLEWYNFSWDRLASSNTEEGNSEEKKEEKQVEIEAWYTPQIPVSHGPSEYWGLPGLILEVSAGNTTMLCSKIVMNSDEKIEINAPSKGKVVTKKEYQEIVAGKMKEFRDNRMRRRQ